MLGSSLFPDCFFGGCLIWHWRSFWWVLRFYIFWGGIAGADPYLCSDHKYNDCKANKEWYQHDKNHSVSTFTSDSLYLLVGHRALLRRIACINVQLKFNLFESTDLSTLNPCTAPCLLHLCSLTRTLHPCTAPCLLHLCRLWRALHLAGCGLPPPCTPNPCTAPYLLHLCRLPRAPLQPNPCTAPWFLHGDGPI